MRSSRVVRVVATLLVATLVLACTGDEPAPAPEPEAEEPDEDADAAGRRIAVVLPPADRFDRAVLDEMTRQLSTAHEVLRGVDEVRAVIPDAPVFVEDLVVSFAEQAVDVVCVVGSGSESLLLELAARYPHVGLCTLTAGPPGGGFEAAGADGRLRRAQLRTDELGHVVGLAARADAGAEGTVGLVLGTTAGDEGFRAGLLAGLGDIDVIEAEVAAGSEPTMTDRLEAVVAAGATHVVVDQAPGASDAVEALAGRAVLLAPEEVVRAAGVDPSAVGGERTPVLLTWELRWARPLAGPAGSLGDDGERPRSLGVATMGLLHVGAAGSESLRTALRAVVRELLRRDRDPLQPVIAPQPGPEAQPPDDADDADDVDGPAGDADDAVGAVDESGEDDASPPPTTDSGGAADVQPVEPEESVAP